MESHRKIVLYIAASLDGFIAREDGSIDWLFSDQDYGYNDFYASIDTVIMGRLTYEQSLAFSNNPFDDKKCYVFTRTNRPAEPNVEFVQADIKDFGHALLRQAGKDIWLVGGGQIIDLFLRENLIDEYIISIHPVLIGKGRPLFMNNHPDIWLEFTSSTHFTSGLVQLRYLRHNK